MLRLFARTLARLPAPKEAPKYRLLSLAGGAAALYLLHAQYRRLHEQRSAATKRRSIERRFLGFASVEHRGQIFMTPADFIESVLEVRPRRRPGRRRLADADVAEIRAAAPPPSGGGRTMFRSLRDNGVISYNEYVFLLTVLTKPRSAFRICFKMFDVDDSEAIDKDEFLVLERVFGRSARLKRGEAATDGDLVDDVDGLQRSEAVDTTLTVHLFGADGRGTVPYRRFERFMADLQEEMFELEFAQFSHGLPTISEADFARILLRYTYLDPEEQGEHLERLRTAGPGISFAEFRSFMLFLNNLSDFAVALNFYWDTEATASVQEFRHAVKACTGQEFSPHLARTIFRMFAGADGALSCREFLAVMNDRACRGFVEYERPQGWQGFRRCVRRNVARLKNKQVA